MIDRILSVNKRAVKRHYQRYLDHPDWEGNSGKPPILAEVQCQELVHEIEFSHARGRSMTKSSIQDIFEPISIIDE
jgi:hypothetical protein